MLDRSNSQRGPSKIGVQDDAGRVDDATQRITERPAQLLLDRARDSGECQVQGLLVQQAGSNLIAHPAQDTPRSIRHGSKPRNRCEFPHGWGPHNLVHRRQPSKKLSFANALHGKIIP